MSPEGGAGIRVRFAPAPTGYLHVGGARTALFNWLFARHHGGTLVLRIEDTDLERSTQAWVEGIQTTLVWLGLDWDEGPYRQSERLGRYAEVAERLLGAGAAYECYCTEEELAARADAARAAGSDVIGYDGRCRNLTTAERKALAADGRPPSIRFRTPDEGVSRFTDAVRGEVAVEWSKITDFVIVRSTGAPVFFLANAVDDADMGITHVIRGEDLLDSTHRVLAIREALGLAGRPQFAHLPLLVGADRQKLSKRHGAVALEDFATQGYLPEALRNYLGLLGFAGVEEGSELRSSEEMVAAFDLARVTRAPAFFDYDKLNWMNGEYIRALPVSDLAERALPHARNVIEYPIDEGVFAGAVAIAQVRATTLVDIARLARFLFVPESEFEIAPESLVVMQKTDRVGEILDSAAEHLDTCEWTAEGVDLRPVLEGLGIKPRKGLPAVYAAVEGTSAGLPLFDSIVLLGRDRTLSRLASAKALIS